MQNTARPELQIGRDHSTWRTGERAKLNGFMLIKVRGSAVKMGAAPTSLGGAGLGHVDFNERTLTVQRGRNVPGLVAHFYKKNPAPRAHTSRVRRSDRVAEASAARAIDPAR